MSARLSRNSTAWPALRRAALSRAVRSVAAAAVLFALPAACTSSALDELAPSSADKPSSKGPGNVAAQPRTTNGKPDFGLTSDPAIPITIATPELDPKHAYSLPELIDLAQMTNPVTRAAWQRARQAAIAVGATEATYLPIITAEVLAGF